FEDETFDVAWLQHVTQSVPDTADMYAEMRRVLKPGGRLVVHDFFRGPGDPIHFPSLMGPEASDVFLVPESELREIFDAAGLELVHWDDRTAEARAHNDVPYDDAESDPAMQAMKVMAENSVKDFDAGSVKMFDALLRRR
ncbi:MAG TPA: methyltransferase domain-containing protein, partial [Baekduia sp.]|nr:methyltransferase domain-containing protein [Baekduia sp.]